MFGTEAMAYPCMDVLEESLSMGVIVPEDRVGAVIGSQGCALKEARLQSGGCKIDVLGESDTDGNRRVNLTGSIDQISIAFGIVCQKVDQMEKQWAPTVLIPANRVGAIVGQGGENLKLVRQMCGVKVSIASESVSNEQMGRLERSLTFHGEPHRWSQACSAALMGIANCVQPPSEDLEQIQIHVFIPAKYLGALMGKDGTNIKQIGAASGCNCSATNRDSGARRIVILGTYCQAESAQTMIWEQLQAAAQEANEEPPANMNVILFIRKEAVGAVLGKQGARLRAFEQRSSATIKMAKHEVQAHRSASINGCLHTILMAEKLIVDVVASVEITPLTTSRKRKGSHRFVKGSQSPKRRKTEPGHVRQ